MPNYNTFPMSYQPMYTQPQYQTYQPQVQQTAPQTTGIIWVQGEAAARSYLMAPNTTLPLWDSESNTIYLKTTDAAGMPSMKVLDYTIRTQSPVNAPVSAPTAPMGDLSGYVTKREFDALQGEIEALREQINDTRVKGANNNGKSSVSADKQHANRHE